MRNILGLATGLTLTLCAPALAQSPAPVAHAGTFDCEVKAEGGQVAKLHGVIGYSKRISAVETDLKIKITSDNDVIASGLYGGRGLGIGSDGIMMSLASDSFTSSTIIFHTQMHDVEGARGAATVHIYRLVQKDGKIYRRPSLYFAGLCSTDLQFNSPGEFFE